jgi:hypothetical protein
MLANTSKPMLRRRSDALEVMLSSLETAGDLLSGSECSSLAASPIDESVFTPRSQSSKQEHGRIGKSQLGSSSLEPVDMVREFLNHLGEPHAAKQFIAQDAKVGCHSRTVPGEHKEREEAPGVTKRDLEDLLASCSSCDIKIDGIFACGEDVAAFGHFAYSDGLESVCRDVHFSIWACVNVAREKIVELRWLDQFVRFEGGSTDGC